VRSGGGHVGELTADAGRAGVVDDHAPDLPRGHQLGDAPAGWLEGRAGGELRVRRRAGPRDAATGVHPLEIDEASLASAPTRSARAATSSARPTPWNGSAPASTGRS
jgi:hypothetical protein